MTKESSDVYAIVRAGGRQEKVSVGDVLIIDKQSAQPGESIELTPLLLVDGTTVTSDAAKLAKVSPFFDREILLSQLRAEADRVRLREGLAMAGIGK